MLLALPYGTYLIFGCLTFLGAAFIYFLVPETKRLSLEEMVGSYPALPWGRCLANAPVRTSSLDPRAPRRQTSSAWTRSTVRSASRPSSTAAWGLAATATATTRRRRRSTSCRHFRLRGARGCDPAAQDMPRRGRKVITLYAGRCDALRRGKAHGQTTLPVIYQGPRLDRCAVGAWLAAMGAQ